MGGAPGLSLAASEILPIPVRAEHCSIAGHVKAIC